MFNGLFSAESDTDDSSEVDEEPYWVDSDENEDELPEPLSAEEHSDIECFGEVAPDGVEFSC